MRKSALVSLVALGLLLGAVAPSYAWGHGRHGHRPVVHTRVFIGVGPAFWWGPPYWWYPPPYYGYAPPTVVVNEPPVYIQQQPAPAPAQAYWYYCQSAGAYYPNVQVCPEAWVRVPARSE